MKRGLIASVDRGVANQIAMVDDCGGITRWAFDSHDPDGSGFRGSVEAARGISAARSRSTGNSALRFTTAQRGTEMGRHPALKFSDGCGAVDVSFRLTSYVINQRHELERLSNIVDCLNQAAHLFGSIFEFDSCQYIRS